MKYLFSVIDEHTGRATPAEMAAIDVFNEKLQANGHWVFAAGLGAPDTATVIDNRRGADRDPIRPDLTADAIRLARLIRELMPEDGEVAGLLALMLLSEARLQRTNGV